MDFENDKALNSLQWLGNNSDDDCNIISVHFRVSKWWIATLGKVFDGNLFERKQVIWKFKCFEFEMKINICIYLWDFKRIWKEKPRDLNSGIEI